MKQLFQPADIHRVASLCKGILYFYGKAPLIIFYKVSNSFLMKVPDFLI